MENNQEQIIVTTERKKLTWKIQMEEFFSDPKRETTDGEYHNGREHSFGRS